MENILDKLFQGLQQQVVYPKEYSKIYKIHKYWARKPWYVVEKYILGFSSVGDMVFDPFCGSGSTGVESITNGRNFLGYDLNPIAVKISEETLNYRIDLVSIQNDLDQITKICKEKILSLYTSDDVCPECFHQTYFKYLHIGPKFNKHLTGVIYCENCNSKKIIKKRPLTDNEKNNFLELNQIEIPYWYPDNSFPTEFYKDRFSYKGIHKVSEMFSRRNLYALALIFDTIKKLQTKNEDLLLLAFSNTLLHVSKLKAENVRPLSVNNYWIPDDYIEENVWFRFNERVSNVLTSKKVLLNKLNKNGPPGSSDVILKSALNIGLTDFADYVFTDPPYGEAIQYSELSYIWNSWISNSYDIKEEIIINPKQDKNAITYNQLLKQALREIYNALKDKRYFTLCFHNKEYSIWKDLIIACKEIGFILDDIKIFDVYGNPYNQSWSQFSPKTDIYVTFLKDTTSELSDLFFNEDTSLDQVVEEVFNYMVKRKYIFDTTKMYDITISLILWNLFYNTGKINITSFNIKLFSKIIDRLQNQVEP